MARYTTNGVPWAIGTDVQDCVTSREVMEKAGLNWLVNKCELSAKMPFTIHGDNSITDVDKLNGTFAKDGFIYRNCPNAYATYRTDKNIPLGLVKSKYEVVQNIDAFNFFDEAIGPDKALWQYAGCLGYGEEIYVAAKLPVETKVGNNDPIENYLVFSNTHNGTKSVTIMFTPVRVFCTNMLNSALDKADSYIRIRHTESIKGKLHEGAEILRIACQYAKDSEQLYNALYATKMNDNEVLQYLANLVLSEKERIALNEYDSEYGYKKLINRDYLTLERTDISVRKANQIQNMFEYYMDGIGQQQIAGTAWGAYNAVTGFYSNVANLEREKRFSSLLFGSAQSAMQNAIINAYDIAKVA